MADREPADGRDAWHVLALSMLSGTVAVREAADALRWTEARARSAMAFLESAHLLVTTREEGRFRVWPPVWRHVWEQLHRRSLLLEAPQHGGA